MPHKSVYFQWTVQIVHSHATRGSVAKTTCFPETISCPAPITGESGRTGRNSGSDGLAKKTTIPNEFRESLRKCPRIEVRADNGRFRAQIYVS
jgi:hypothetical protein